MPRSILGLLPALLSIFASGNGKALQGTLRPTRLKSRLGALPENTEANQVDHSISWAGGRIPDRAIVLARSNEDISWLDVYFNNIPHMVYNTNLLGALHPAVGGGMEDNQYLQYIVDMYDQLPNITLFSHASRCSWHGGDMVKVIQHLDWEPPQHVTNVRCKGLLGNENNVLHEIDASFAQQNAEAIFSEEYSSKFKSPWAMTYEARMNLSRHLIAAAWGELYEPFLGALPEKVGFPCCSTMLVTREAIHRRPRRFYEHIQRWLAQTKIDRHWATRITEATWHIVFGEQPVLPPLPECRVFKCTGGRSEMGTIQKC